VFERIAHTAPRLGWGRRQEPAFSHGLLGIRNAAPHPDAAFGCAAKISQAGVHDGRMSDDDCHA
jgi:hypothetical protein